MANVFLATMLFILSVTMFSFSTSYGALERSFQGVDETFVSQCINATDSYMPFFDFEKFNDLVNEYLIINLDRYKPMLSYHFECDSIDGYYEEGEYRATYVTFALNGSFLSSYNYSNFSSFYIKGGDSIYG